MKNNISYYGFTPIDKKRTVIKKKKKSKGIISIDFDCISIFKRLFK